MELDKDTLKRYPEFNRDAFLAMNDEEARRYEWRVLEAIDPELARSSTREWDYERLRYYRQPEWFGRDVIPSGTGASRTGTDASRARGVQVTEREDRERVVASEDMYEREPSPTRDRIRGQKPDDDLR
jgi:hypothetical protein